MVARQFRVLEAASSSPATSTKNMGRASLSPYFCLWCPDSTSSAQRNACALILRRAHDARISAASRIILPLGKAPATPSSRTDRLELVLRAERSRIECANFAGECVKLACKPSAKLFCRRQSPSAPKKSTHKCEIAVVFPHFSSILPHFLKFCNFKLHFL